MSLGLLPWEKWLPPYIFGPLLFFGSIGLMLAADLAKWEFVIFIFTAAYGGIGTGVWLMTRRNIFNFSATTASQSEKSDPEKSVKPHDISKTE